jgi:biopolymer transport protein ExbB
MSYSKHKGSLFLAALARQARLMEPVPGAANNGKNKMQMQSGPHIQSSSCDSMPWRRSLRAAAILAFALLISAPFADSAWAQGTIPPATAQPSAPPAAVPAVPFVPNSTGPNVTAPNAAAPAGASTASTPQAPAATATGPEPQATPNGGTTSAVATPGPGEPSVGGDLLPQKLSLVGMYLDADRVVKAVMIGLAFASLVTWTVFFAKTWELYTARMEVRRGLHILVDSLTLAQAHDQLRDGTTPVAQLMQAAAQEIRLSSGVRGDGLKERIAWQLERLEMATSRKISRGTGVLATIGSTAPFVGLFGTVWGIMNSFIGISNAHTTNLAVVAPGIAQALLATAMGLVAAIPAVMIYNVLARQTAHYRALLGDASAQVMRLVSRDLDRAKSPLAQAAE